MKTLSADMLFTPIQVGPMKLKHRGVMSPLTRSRSIQPGSIPGDLMLEYYSQRASDGGLIVSEGTSISIAGGMVRSLRLVFRRAGCGREENHERRSR
jgi:N-ethylmaleimide reductase